MLTFGNKNLLPFLLHFAGWALFFYLTIPHFNRAERSVNGGGFPPFLLIEYALLAIYFYLNTSVFVPRLLSKKKIIRFLAITLAAFLLFCLVVPWLVRQHIVPLVHEAPFRPGTLSRRPHFAPHDNGDAFQRIIFPDLFRRLGMYSRTSQFLVVFIISTGLKAVAQWYAEKRRLQELETSMVQAELSFLKSQIHPHFLFNSLNSIYYLYLSKDDWEPEAILSLSDFLRFVTTECNHSRIPLEKEVKMLEEYIHLQSLRASEKFELQFRTEGDFRGQVIMPLTFVPFVENAFKYGISAHTDCFIHVGMEAKDGVLLFTCDNSSVAAISDRERSTGIGLDNIRKRLELAYPERHRLEIHSDRQAFHVKLQILPA
jgi:hypothetical protein